MFKTISIVLSFITVLSFGQEKKYEPTWVSLDARETPKWFEDAKFGIFIHWGLFSVPAWAPTRESVYENYSEWYWWRLTDTTSKVQLKFKSFHDRTYGQKLHYAEFAKDFKCELFQPEQWADLFLKSGAKYIVLTTKHHEGFTLWPSKQSWNWNSVDIGPHRDLVGDLTTSVREAGLRMGFYYSLYEWFNPLYKDIEPYVDHHMIPQMKDLVLTYKPDILWTDGQWDHPSDAWKSKDFLSWLYNESPIKKDVVVNDRWGAETRGKHGGIYTTEYELDNENKVSKNRMTHPWEECRGIGGSFGYNRNEQLKDYSSSKALIHILIEKVAHGGNLLLNIGPTADGQIPVIMQQRLNDIGEWLRVNGEAIYGTRAWYDAPANIKNKNIFFTAKGNDLYVICTKFPQTAFEIQGIRKPNSVSMLGLDRKVDSSFSKGKLKIVPPIVNPGNSPCDYAWVFLIENALKN